MVEREFGVGCQVAMFGENTGDALEVGAHGRVVGVVALVDDGGAFVWVHAYFDASASGAVPAS